MNRIDEPQAGESILEWAKKATAVLNRAIRGVGVSETSSDVVISPYDDDAFNPSIVGIYNDTGSDLPAWSAVGLTGGTLYSPDTQLQAFLGRIVLAASTPTRGLIGVTTGIIKAGQSGYAAVAGIVPVQIYFTAGAAQTGYADADSTVSGPWLVPAYSGARVIFCDTVPSGGGLAWAYILLPCGSPLIRFGALSSNLNVSDGTANVSLNDSGPWSVTATMVTADSGTSGQSVIVVDRLASDDSSTATADRFTLIRVCANYTTSVTGTAYDYSLGQLSQTTVSTAGPVNVAAPVTSVVIQFAGPGSDLTRINTTTTITAPSSCVYGQALTITASVAAASGTSTPTGVVVVYDQFNVTLGVISVSGSGGTAAGTGSLNYFPTDGGTGSRTLTGVYQGDSNFNNSTSSAVSITVNAVNTSINFAAVGTVTYGDAVTLLAEIAVASPGQAGPMLTGTVEFSNGSTVIGTATVVYNSTIGGYAATLVTTGTPAGNPVTVSGAFTPFNSVFNAGTGSTSFVVNKAGLTVTADSQTMYYGTDPTSYLSAAITGFLNGDSPSSSVTGSPGISTTATSSSSPGSYPITVTIGTLSSANYDFPNLVNGAWMVQAVPLTLTVDSKAMFHGVRNATPPDTPVIPNFTSTLSGVVNSDTFSITYYCSADGYTVGMFTIVASITGTHLDCYILTISQGTLVVN